MLTLHIPPTFSPFHTAPVHPVKALLHLRPFRYCYVVIDWTYLYMFIWDSREDTQLWFQGGIWIGESNTEPGGSCSMQPSVFSLSSASQWSKECESVWRDHKQPFCPMGPCWWASSAVQNHLFTHYGRPYRWICKFSNALISPEMFSVGSFRLQKNKCTCST